MISESQLTERLFRHQSGKMNSILLNQFGFEYSELIDDIIQETFITALKQWGIKGVPENPEGWLMQVAKNKFLNEINRKNRHGKLNYRFVEQSDIRVLENRSNDEDALREEQVKSLFACCSPKLTVKVQIMLILKIISGFGDREIAGALLMSTQAVRKSIYRARNTLKEVGLASIDVNENDYIQRLDTVLRALYLIFNEGYHSSSGDKVLDEDVSFEAIRLTKWLLEIDNIQKGNIHALLSLMLFNFSRFDSRTNELGELIDIEHQDRNKWNHQLIHQGVVHQKKSREGGQFSRYHIECGIAAVHCLSKNFEETNWNQIVSYYERLIEFDQSQLAYINYSIALSESGNSEKSLEILKGLEKSKNYKKSLLFGAIGRVYQNLKNTEMAKSYYKVALDLSDSKVEKAFYEKKLSNLLLNTEGLQN